MGNLIEENDLSFIVFSNIYHRFTVPKTRRKALSILESAISCYERCGFEGTTYKMIAREAGLKTASLRHYFITLDEIQVYTVKYVHCTAQRVVVERMKGETDPLEMFRKYLDGHYQWATQYRKHIFIWNLFIAYGAKDASNRALNTEAIRNGAKRISEILARGRKAGVFKHTSDIQTARLIQTLLLGWITALATEDIEDTKKHTQFIFNHCFEIVTKC